MSTLCRLCATETVKAKQVDIFGKNLKNASLSIASKIDFCLGLNVEETDDYPKIMCTDCFDKLQSYSVFKECCVKTNSYFQNNYRKKHRKCKEKATICDDELDIIKEEPESDEECRYSSDDEHQESGNELIGDIGEHNYSKAAIKDGNEQRRDENNKNEQVENIICEPTLFQQPMGRRKRAPVEFQCYYCEKIFYDRQKTLDHIECDHKKIHRCNFCPEMFRSALSLLKHEKNCKVSESDNIIHSCKFCPLIFRSGSLFFEHLKSHRGQIPIIIAPPKDPYSRKCEYCGKEFTRKGSYDSHLRTHTGERPFECQYCKEKFAVRDTCNRHVLRVHEKRWKITCDYCGKGFYSKKTLRWHVQKHHTKEFDYPCPKCDMKFVNKHSLRSHDGKTHFSGEASFTCEVCGRSFKCIEYLKNHKKIHESTIEERKKFECNICNLKLITKLGLKRHMYSHTGELPYKCDQCDKAYKCRGGLRIHLLIHSGVKKFMCDICGKAFALKNTLDMHKRTHTGERPYQCDICQQSFTQHSSLKAHRMRHANNRR